MLLKMSLLVITAGLILLKNCEACAEQSGQGSVLHI
jgi:hypothetical protein